VTGLAARLQAAPGSPGARAGLRRTKALAAATADTLRAGQLGQDALDWLKTNFYKTELELAHCLRLPQEGPPDGEP